MNIYILLAHPNSLSFNGAIADKYYQTAVEMGHNVRIQRLGEMRFDPILHNGYKTIQPLEPDLLQAQENIKWCQHWVIVYPQWWGSVPAILKGFFDRVMLPDFAYKYHTDNPLWNKLLKGKTAHVITTCDAPSLYVRLKYRNSDISAVRYAVLNFCGISKVKVTRIDRLKYRDERAKIAILQKITSKIVRP